MLNKIVVMAAGKGTRMLQLSQDQPKHLIGVKNRPFLYYALNNINQAGFEEIILVVGYKKEKMEEFAENYKGEFNLKLVDQFEIMGTEKYGTAMPVAAGEKLIGQENFAVVNGDDLYAIEDLQKMRGLDDDLIYAGGMTTDNPAPYGILKTDEQNFLQKIIEKPQPDADFDARRPRDYLVNIGIYKFTPEIFRAIKNIGLSKRGEYEITDAITLLAKEKKVKTIKVTGKWKSFTNPEDVGRMEEYLR
jgi:dTDP-glucose pyrophosphorylase